MRELLMKYFSLIMVPLTLMLSGLFGMGRQDAMRAVEKNVVEGLLNGTLPLFSGSDIADGATLLSLTAEDADGNLMFTDVDYENQDRSSWKTVKHISRTLRLAVLFRQETDPQLKAAYKDAVLRLLAHWIAHDYTNPNWWHNKLSNPNILGEIGLLMKEALPADLLKGLAPLVGRGCYSIDPTLRAYPGANTMDIAMSSIKYGLLTGYAPAVKTALNEVSGALKYSLSEGIKRDGTFFQHGNRLYMGGYGVGYISSFLHIARMVSGTDYMFSADQLEPLAKFITEGMRTVSFGSTLDPTVMGRSVSRMNAQPLMGLARTLTQLAEIPGMPRRAEILAYAASIQNDEKRDTGLHYFENAKFLVIRNADFYFSFRGGDNLLYYAEITNDENVLCYNSTFPGVTTIMHTGREYVNISPLFDYSMVPGTTAVPETDEEIYAHEDATYRRLPGVYGSSVADGAAAVFAKTKHEGIGMTVACFATDHAALLLGAGMKDGKGREMRTTLDQCFYAGSHTQEGNVVIHNGIKYELLEGGALIAENEHRTGSWRRNNRTLAEIPAEGDIFTVYTENTGSYAYSVMAEGTQARFEVIVNTPAVQAVRLPDGRLAAAFYTAGSFTYQGRTYLGVPGTAKIFG